MPEMMETLQYRPMNWQTGLPSDRRFSALCLLCDTYVYVSQAALRRDIIRWRGTPRTFCAHVRSQLVTPPPRKPKPAARPKAQPDGEARAASEAKARAILERHRYTPLGPYPGYASSEWPSECEMCGAHVWIRPDVYAHRPVRTLCSHPINKTIKPAPARQFLAQKLTQEMKRKGSS